MPKEFPILTPDDVRQLRERLGMTQAQAGEAFGGGPKAFAKYETGKATPSAPMMKLLQHAQRNPHLFMSEDAGVRKNTRISINDDPVHVSAEEVSRLKQTELPELLRRLFHAEIEKYQIEFPDFHVSSAINTSDGGEDGRIQWSRNPSRTPYLPSQFCLFQLKAGKITGGKAAEDIFQKKTKQLEPSIAECLQSGGTYLMLCTHAYPKKQISNREEALRDKVKECGLEITPSQIIFRDADQIADWINHYPVVVRWLLEKTSPGKFDCLRTFESWEENYFLDWVEDERSKPLQERLQYFVKDKHHTDPILRIVGLSGIGKSHLLLQAFINISQKNHLFYRVLYADESETLGAGAAIIEAIRNLKEARKSAILIVDKCTLETQEKLESHVRASDGRLLLITLEDDNPAEYSNIPSNDPRFFVERADDKTIEGIIDGEQPGLSPEDKRRLIKFSDGYPKLAVLLAEHWDRATGLKDDLCLTKKILEKSSRYSENTFQTACLLSCFQAVLPSANDSQLKTLAELSGNQLSIEKLSTQISILKEIGVLHNRGRFVWVQPRPLALELAATQWAIWRTQTRRWDEILSGDYNLHLKKNAAKQLALLNTRDIARKVVWHVCRLDGPLSTFEKIDRHQNAEILSYFAEVDADTVIRLLEHVLPESLDLQQVEGDTRRHLVGGLEKIAFCKETFERGACLLLRLAVAENETWANNATGQFQELFPVLLGNTEADAEMRLQFLQDVLEHHTPEQLPIIGEALLKGIAVNYFSRTIGAEIHGSKPALELWHPETWGEAWIYIGRCLDLLLTIVVRNNEVGRKFKADLGSKLRSFANHGKVDFLEKIINTVTGVYGSYWPEASTSLSHALMYDQKGMPSDTKKRIKDFIEQLKPQDLSSRIKFLVTDMPWDYPSDKDLEYQERNHYQEKILFDLAKDVLRESAVEKFIPQLCLGSHRMSVVFGKAIAEIAENPSRFLSPIKDALKSIPEKERDFNFLSGYLLGLYPNYPAVIERFKQEASTDPVFAPSLPIVCLRTDLKDGDISLAIKAHKDKLFPTWLLKNWALGGKIANVSAPTAASLFDYLFAGDAEAFSVGLDLIGMYAYRRRHTLEDLRPQIKNVALAARRLSGKSHRNDEYHFKELMLWLLNHGRQDQDARDLALILVKTAIEAESFSERRFIKPLMPKLLHEFTEVTWPPIAKSVMDNPLKRWELSGLLGERFSFGERATPPILSMPEDVLKEWCRSNPDIGPEFLANIAPALTSRNPTDTNRTFHPLTRWLIDEYGEKEAVLSGIANRMHNFTWSGSLTTYYDLFHKPFSELLNHPKGAVRRWAETMCEAVGREVDREAQRDEEQAAIWDV